MRLDGNHYIQIACRAAVDSRLALSPDRNYAFIVYTCRYFYGKLDGLFDFSASFAVRTVLFDYLSAAAALVAGRNALELSERSSLSLAYLAAAAALRTGFLRCSGFCALAFARRALDEFIDFNFFFINLEVDDFLINFIVLYFLPFFDI